MLYFLGLVKGIPYMSLGCWKSPKGPGYMEPTTEILDGHYKNRTDPIRKCYEALKPDKRALKGPIYFSLFDGGKCMQSLYSYYEAGQSLSCGLDGTGGADSMNTYIIMGKYFEYKRC